MARPLPSLPVGSTFNHWTVLESQSVSMDKKYSAYKCQCKCGTVKYVRSDHLRFGNSKSCGCLLSDSTELANKFWSKSEKKDNGCWEWKQCRRGEYGTTIFRAKSWRAHRLAYFLTHGEFDYSLHVLHKCDNPRCVNPDHLFLGTIQDNNKDCFTKDRHTKGELRNFKLYDKDVLIIRELRDKHRIPCKDLARMWDVSESMIQKIIYRKEWKHI